MRLHRFCVSQPLGEEVVIKEVTIIKQWLKVFRYTQSDLVILFNGDGYDVTYSLEIITPKECTLTRVTQTASYIPNKKTILYLSLIKKDNFELVVQKATELGITTIVPIISLRSEKKNLNMDRLHSIATEASEQCGRGDVPTILPITTLTDELPRTRDGISLLLQMGGTSIQDTNLQVSLTTHNTLHLFIGPEGGWTPEEETLFIQAHITPISLGKTVLRAETAAIVACGHISTLL